MELHVKALQELTHILDYVMPGIKKLFSSWNEANGKDKLSDYQIDFLNELKEYGGLPFVAYNFAGFVQSFERRGLHLPPF